MSESMDEAHSRDTRRENRLRKLRQAILELEDGDLNPADMEQLKVLRVRVATEMDRIVARWN